MQSGRLRFRITIQQPADTIGSAGEIDQAWTTYAVRWASIMPLSGKEFYASKQLNAETTHKITIRYTSGVTTKMRVSYDSRIFAIESIINFGERNKEMQLMCVEDV